MAAVKESKTAWASPLNVRDSMASTCTTESKVMIFSHEEQSQSHHVSVRVIGKFKTDLDQQKNRKCNRRMD
jgi:hypothetical protein